ncbi:MAG: 23S rRNA (guanosine(2251)-2'-O)-methyltransferase RlmB [Alkalispirochaetaceae bacterium]
MLTQKHAIEEYLRSGGGGTLFVSQGARKAEGLVSLAREHGVTVKVISPNRLKRLAPRVGSWCFQEEGREERRPDFEEWLQSRGDQESLLILLDHVTDPHNLGAVLRSCDQFGADLVVLPERRSAGLGGVVADTSAGAVEHVPVSMVPNLANALVRLQDAGFWVYAAHMEGSPLWKVRFPTKTAVILGSEGKGVSELLKKRSDELVAIPRYGEIDSLNVSVAAGVFLYEFRRQHP